MKRPRCGVPDQFGVQMKSNMRRKRYALTGRRWSQSHLTFRYPAISTRQLFRAEGLLQTLWARVAVGRA